MRAQAAMLVGLAVLVAAVFVGAGRTWGAVAMGLAGIGLLVVGVVGAVTDGRT